MADTSPTWRGAPEAELEQCDGCTPRKSTHTRTQQNRHPKFWVAYDGISLWGFSGKGHREPMILIQSELSYTHPYNSACTLHTSNGASTDIQNYSSSLLFSGGYNSSTQSKKTGPPY
jgi:hypothetical protein